MKKNGFVFIETIVAIVILTSSLLLLYNTFTKILQLEKSEIYYDDIAYIYRTYYLKERFNKLNIKSVLNDLQNNKDKYFVTIGIEYQNLFEEYETEKNYISNMLEDYDVKQIVVLKENKIDNIRKCTIECSLDSECNEYENCNGLYSNLSEEFIKYLKSLYIDVSCTYIMAIEYNTCTGSNGFDNCKKYYSWVSV